MQDVEVTRMSSRGQVVIPQTLRKTMHMGKGTKFVVVGDDNTIILKRIEMPSFKGFERLLVKSQKWAKTKKLRPKDVENARKNI